MKEKADSSYWNLKLQVLLTAFCLFLPYCFHLLKFLFKILSNDLSLFYSLIFYTIFEGYFAFTVLTKC